MKNVLIFINNSLGELDWISPFLNSKEGEEFNFYVFLNGPGNTYIEKQEILKKYKLVAKNIYLLNEPSRLDITLFKVDDFLNKVTNRLKLFSLKLSKLSEICVDVIRYIVSCTYPIKNDIKFQYIFRDYNLKDSFILKSYIVQNKQAKILIFPHAVGIVSKHDECCTEPIKRVKADVWLENSEKSDVAKHSIYYKDAFFASGAPSFDLNYEKTALFNYKIKRVIIITRDCGMTFGFNYDDAFIVFDKLLECLTKMGYEIVIKHHPRDTKLDKWRAIQQKYPKIEEFNENLNNIEDFYTVCFTLFSTAPLFLLSRHIPIFEFSPYKHIDDYKKKMPMHYPNRNGILTHDLIELELYKRVDDLSTLGKYLSEEYLESLSRFQFMKCRNIFLSGANNNIKNKLLELDI